MPKPQADGEDTIPIPEATLRHRDWRRVERIAQLAMIVGAFLLIYFLTLSIYPSISAAYAVTIRPFIVQYWPNFLTVIALTILGFILYTFRGYKSLWFGIAEMVLAIGLSWYAVNKIVFGDVSDAVVFMFAALYLSGRAWINISTKVHPLQIEKE